MSAIFFGGLLQKFSSNKYNAFCNTVLCCFFEKSRQSTNRGAVREGKRGEICNSDLGRICLSSERPEGGDLILTDLLSLPSSGEILARQKKGSRRSIRHMSTVSMPLQGSLLGKEKK